MNKKDISIETSKALEEIYYQYTHLPLGGKEIPCPYWRNRLSLGITGPFGGKGRPEEIVEATKKVAQEAKMNLNLMSEAEILAFMKRKKIGIDCSGFAYWLLDALDKERGGKGIADLIPCPPGSLPQRQANVKKLTSEDLTVPVEKINEIKVGDLIRLQKGKHLAVVRKIIKEEGILKEIEYVHSSEKTKITGVHSGLIKVVDPHKTLAEQEWLEILANGEDYRQIFFPSFGDGIRRLKIWL